jgi:hypothetical protein
MKDAFKSLYIAHVEEKKPVNKKRLSNVRKSHRHWKARGTDG